MRTAVGHLGSGRRLGMDAVDAGIECVLHPAELKDVENALAGPERVDQFFAVLHEHRVRTRNHQVRGGDVTTEVVPHEREHGSHLLELDSRVQQALDDLELEEIAIGVLPSAAATARIGERRTNEVGASPVDQLAIGDPNDLRGSSAGEPVDLGSCCGDLFGHWYSVA